MQVFRRTTEAELATKEHGTPLPGWAKAVTAPGRLSEQLINKIRLRFTVSFASSNHRLLLTARICVKLLQVVSSCWRYCLSMTYMAYLRHALIVQRNKEESKEAPLPQAEAFTKSAEGETVISFSQESAGSQTRRACKSFRSCNLSQDSSHLAA